MGNEGTAEGSTTTGGTTGQTTPPAWLGQLPTDLKGNEAFTGFQTIGDMAKSFLALKGKAAELDGIKPKLETAIFKPGEKATPEEITAFRKALGVPDKADAYEIPTVEGQENSPEMMKWARETFHKIGLTAEQGKAIATYWNQFMSAMVKAELDAAEKARSDAETALKTELGGEEKYKEAAELVRRLLTQHAKPEEKAILEDPKFGNNPLLIRLVTTLAKKTGEDTTPQGKGGGASPVVGMNYTTMDQFKGG